MSSFAGAWSSHRLAYLFISFFVVRTCCTVASNTSVKLFPTGSIRSSSFDATLDILPASPVVGLTELEPAQVHVEPIPISFALVTYSYGMFSFVTVDSNEPLLLVDSV